LSCLKKRRPRGNLVALCNFLSRGNGEERASLFSLITNDKTQMNGTKLLQSRFKLDIREILYPEGGQTLEQA